MKHLKTYEERKYSRNEYKYLNKEDSKKLENFIQNYINEHMVDYIKSIKKLNLDDFEDKSFDIDEMLDLIVEIDVVNYGNQYKGNLYYHVDMFCDENEITDTIPAIRNSISVILVKILPETKLMERIEQKLIKLFEKNPKVYLSVVKDYDLPEGVKKACDYIEEADKFNL